MGSQVVELKLLGCEALVSPRHHFDLISTIHDNIQNMLCNLVASCPQIIHTEFHQNQT